ncbi:MAG TPA: energy transducer TonB [Candidatus Acidoferrales bacterium]|nr:energy transducer TonB [Candidatus Acidoferrales bacterium]
MSLFALLIGVVLLPVTVKSQDSDSATKRKVSHRVVPEFPALARQMNISGKVKLEATVEPDGHVKSTRAVGGSPLLIQSATQALKNWKFEPGPKETTEIIEFDFKDQ